MYAVYALIDPRDNTIRYIGITNDVYGRFQQHIRGMDRNYGKSVWIQELRILNKMVIMETLEECENYEKACERELYWIKHFEMLKEPLLNISRTTSPRKSKKTNLSMGRNMLLDMAQATILAMQQDTHMHKPLPAIEPPTIEPATVKPPTNEPRTVEPAPERRIVFEPKVPHKGKCNYDYALALQAWNAGHRSARDLAKALTRAGNPVGKDVALIMIKEMKSKNLI